MAASKRSEFNVPATYLEHLRKSYGSLTSPRLRFVLDAVDRKPFAGLVDDLSRTVPVRDDTDINCDVSFTLILDGAPVLVVKLSMVGPYAVVLHFGDDGLAARGRLLAPQGHRGSGGPAENVFSVLSRHGFIFPDRRSLESHVPIALPGGGEVTLYSALFAPADDIPWD